MKKYILNLDEKEKNELEIILNHVMQYSYWPNDFGEQLYLKVKDLKCNDQNITKTIKSSGVRFGKATFKLMTDESLPKNQIILRNENTGQEVICDNLKMGDEHE